MVLTRTTYACLVLASSVLGAGRIERPVLGYVHEPEGKTIRAVTGVPGSALLDETLPNASKLERVYFAPGNRFALAAVLDEPELRAISWNNAGVTSTTIEGSSSNATLVAIAGEFAAVYDSGVVQIWRGLPSAPSLHRRLDVGEARAIAVSYDGAAIAVADSGGLAIWTGDEKRVAASGEFTAAYFLPDSNQVIALDKDRLVRFSPDAATIANLHGATLLALSADGAYAAVADDNSVTVIDVSSGEAVTGQLRVQSLAPLDSRGVFYGVSKTGECWVIDIREAAMRIVFAGRGGAQ